MCGISGWVGVEDYKTRYALALVLGMGIDKRGGHAAGFASYGLETDTGKISVCRKEGQWESAKDRFIRRAASGTTCLQHARYATCGKRHVTEAHPFTIRRDGKAKLYGAHNGMVYNADESAKEHNRKIVVDSEEIFELLADEDYEGIKKLQGYGVITWIDHNNPSVIKVLRLSKNSDFYIVRAKTGGLIYGSTRKIVDDAMDAAGIETEVFYDVEIGQVYTIKPDNLYFTNTKDIVFAERKWNYPSYGGYTGGYSNYSPTRYSSRYNHYRADDDKRGYFDWEDDYDYTPGSSRFVNKTPTSPPTPRFTHDEMGRLVRVADDKKDEIPDTLDLAKEYNQKLLTEGTKDSQEPKEFFCESCGEDVDEETADFCTYQYEEIFGRKDAPILCSNCLFDCGTVAATLS